MTLAPNTPGAVLPDGAKLGMWRAAVTAWRPPGDPGEPLKSTDAGAGDLLALLRVALGPWEQGNERAKAVAASLLSVFIEAAGYCLTSPPTFKFV